MARSPHFSLRHIARTLTRRAGAPLLAALFLTRCGSEALEVNGGAGRTFAVAAGQELDIRLQNIGPGEYRAPPAISSGAIKFLDVSVVGPPVPAGETQLFRFRAITPGRSLVTFRHTEQSAVVIDTVEVR
ncbi:MAG: hypothetical protein ACJ8DC_09165 [Gemmatimonadales bacterium]